MSTLWNKIQLFSSSNFIHHGSTYHPFDSDPYSTGSTLLYEMLKQVHDTKGKAIDHCHPELVSGSPSCGRVIYSTRPILLFEAEAAVNQEELSCNKIGIVRGKKEDRFSNVFGLCHPLEVSPLNHCLLNLFRQRFGHFR